MPSYQSLSGTPDRSEWHPFHLAYLGHLLPGLGTEMGHSDDAISFLEAQLRDLESFLGEVPAERETYRYAPGKWSLREVVGHLSDTERILSFRALAAARGDVSLILPFDEDAYAAASGHDALPLHRLGLDLLAVRRSTLSLFSTFRHDDWRGRGNSGSHPVSARAWAFAIGAHAQLHLGTLRTRYLAEV
jgi:DinB superfamily